MNHDKAMLRCTGIYCAFTIVLTIFLAVTLPNGKDSGWHLYLMLLMVNMWMWPFLLFSMAWLAAEIRRWPFVEKDDLTK